MKITLDLEHGDFNSILRGLRTLEERYYRMRVESNQRQSHNAEQCFRNSERKMKELQAKIALAWERAERDNHEGTRKAADRS